MRLREILKNRRKREGSGNDGFGDLASLVKEGDIEQARQKLEAMIVANPERAFPYFLMGILSTRDNQREEALAWYDKALEINPEMKPALVQKGRLLAMLDDRGAAKEAYQTLLEVDPGNSKARLNIGKLSMAEGDPELAEEEIRSVLAANPQNTQARLMLAQVLMRKGQEAEAISWLKETVRDNPKVAAAHQTLGMLYEKLGEFEDARSAYMLAVEHSERSPGALFRLGNIDFLRREFASAESIFRELLIVKKQSKKTLYRLAESLIMLDRDDEAIHLLQQEIRDSKRKTMAHGLVGYVYAKQQRHDMALAEFRAHAQNVSAFGERLPQLHEKTTTAVRVIEIVEEAASYVLGQMFSNRRAEGRSKQSRSKIDPRLIELFRNRRQAQRRDSLRKRRGASDA